MVDDNWEMTNEERRVHLEAMLQDGWDRLTPFQKYLHDNGLFDDVIRPALSPDDTILEPCNLCEAAGCEHCIGYWKEDGQVTYCTCEHHKNEKPREVPYDHCEDLGCDNCFGVVTENTIVSFCTCTHHKKEVKKLLAE